MGCNAQPHENVTRNEGVDRTGIHEKVHWFALRGIGWIRHLERQDGQTHVLDSIALLGVAAVFQAMA
jgi:hypothetical protein